MAHGERAERKGHSGRSEDPQRKPRHGLRRGPGTIFATNRLMRRVSDREIRREVTGVEPRYKLSAAEADAIEDPYFDPGMLELM